MLADDAPDDGEPESAAGALAGAASARQNRSNARAASSATMPGPSSATVSTARPRDRSQRISTVVVASVWTSAFVTRFATTCRSRVRVAQHHDRLGGEDPHAPRRVGRPGVVRGVVRELREVHRSAREGGALVEVREEQQIFHEAPHAAALVSDAAHHLGELVVADRALAPQVREASDRGDGGPELMGRVGDEPAELRLRRVRARRACG